MTIRSGLGAQFYVDGYDLSGDTKELSRIGGGHAVLDKTGINQSAFQRAGGRRDGGFAWTSHFNPITDAQHKALSLLPTTNRQAMYAVGTSVGSVAAACNAKQIGYDGTFGNDGDFTFSVDVQADSYGLEFGNLLTAGKRHDTAAANGAGFDSGAAHSYGLQAYLQVFAFTGTSATVKIQQSSDNGVGDAYADVTGGGFSAATARSTQRIATANNLALERWLRVVTTGTFTVCDFVVMVSINETAGVVF